MTTREISNMDDVIDSRDVIARIEELEQEIADDSEAAGTTWDTDESVRGDMDRAAFIAEHLDVSLSGEVAELAALKALAEQAEGYAPDWESGATLVRDSYFETYAQKLVEDIGAMPKGFPSYIEIDWEATARNIRMDYTSVEFDGVTYWVR